MITPTNPTQLRKLTPMELYAKIEKDLENNHSEAKRKYLALLLFECQEKEKALQNAK